MSKAKILITRKWPESVEAELMKHYDVQCNDSDVAMTVDELRAALGEYDAILPTVTDNMGAGVFDADTIRTKAICNYGVGFSHIYIPAAQAAGIAEADPDGDLSGMDAAVKVVALVNSLGMGDPILLSDVAVEARGRLEPRMVHAGCTQ